MSPESWPTDPPPTETASERLTVAAVPPVEPDESDLGKTSIADLVVAKIAAVATRGVRGVYSLGPGAPRAFGALRDRIPGQRVGVAQGVLVEVGERQAAVDLDLVVEYGYRIVDVADQVRRSVIAAVEEMVALEVTEVNIAISDVHLPGEDGTESRVL